MGRWEPRFGRFDKTLIDGMVHDGSAQSFGWESGTGIADCTASDVDGAFEIHNIGISVFLNYLIWISCGVSFVGSRLGAPREEALQSRSILMRG